MRHGALLVDNGRIADVGPLPALRSRHPLAQTCILNGCVLAPGLINAHTHLCLTALRHITPDGDFPRWIARITAAIQALDAEDFASSAALGAAESLLSGVTSVGDIAYGAESGRAAGALGLGGVFFQEVLGITAIELPALLRRHEFPLEPPCADNHPVAPQDATYGLSPHAPYSCGPGLLRAARALTRTLRIPCAIHVAESLAERQLLRTGDGPLAANAVRLAPDFIPPRTGSVAYLDSLGVLDGTIAIHCVNLDPGEPELLATRAAGAVLCPRSNAFLGNGAPPVAQLRRAGVRLAIGTDSAASNADLDLLAEASALRLLDPQLTPAKVFRMLTLDGAAVLGQTHAGSLVPGARADIVALQVDSAHDPLEAIVSSRSPRVRATMTAGKWRVFDGEPVFDLKAMQQKAARVAEKAMRAASKQRR